MRTLVRNNRVSKPAVGFFDDFFSPINYWVENFNKENPDFFPPVNAKETEEAYLLEIVAPGMKKDDFKIKAEGDLLTISAERKEEKEENKKGQILKEYTYRSFSRSFSLNDDVDQNLVEAKYEDGVLKLVLPKKEEKIIKPKEIAVK